MKTQEECQEVLRFATEAQLAGAAIAELGTLVDPQTGAVIPSSQHDLNMAVLFGMRSVLEWIVSEGETSLALERAEDGKPV